MMYNGAQYTWSAFKQYWKQKPHGAWHFDTTKSNAKAYKARFERLWAILGPIFCKKQNLKYVEYSMAYAQRQEAASVHYIFALDESGSMRGERWANLLTSFRETINKLKEQDAGRKDNKVSLIKFESNARMVCENQSPDQIDTNLECKGGGTEFDPPFIMAADIATKYIEHATVIFIFMTDGCGSYPKKGM